MAIELNHSYGWSSISLKKANQGFSRLVENAYDYCKPLLAIAMPDRAAFQPIEIRVAKLEPHPLKQKVSATFKNSKIEDFNRIPETYSLRRCLISEESTSLKVLRIVSAKLLRRFARIKCDLISFSLMDTISEVLKKK